MHIKVFTPSRLFIAALGLTTIWGVSATAQKSGPAAPKPTAVAAVDTVALAEPEVKQLLLLMDTDQNGKISKKEFIDFMNREFDRLDMDKSGELDPRELTKSRFRASTFAATGK
jgi:hypothetical protein